MLRVRRYFLSIIFIILFIADAVPVYSEEILLSDVPGYLWHHGCCPTSGAMIMGYWDAHGYPDLIPGSNNWNTNRNNIKNSIASEGHIDDYALYDGVDDYGWDEPYTDMSEINPDGAHADDCLADFMKTSRSAKGLTHGATSSSDIDNGIEDYASYKGYSFDADFEGYFFFPSWETFTEEIQFGQPLVMMVDSNGDGKTDHCIAAIGYRDTNGYNEYACWDTWSHTIRWERYREVSSSYDWGVKYIVKVCPDGTRDTAFKDNAGSWDNSFCWDNGIPDANSFAYVPVDSSITIGSTTSAQAKMLNNAGTLTINGSLSAGDVHNWGDIYVEPSSSTQITRMIDNEGTIAVSAGVLQCGEALYIGYLRTGTLNISNGGGVEVGGNLQVSFNGTLNIDSTSSVGVGGSIVFKQDSTLTAQEGAEIHMTGANFQNESTNSANLAGLSNLTLIFEGGSEVVDDLEVAGKDEGAVLSAFSVDNFLIGTLQLGGEAAGRIKLVDNFDNQSGWSGSEALYVSNLIMNAGATIDLNDLHLYYLNGGSPKQFFNGDANLDGSVDISDFGILAGNYGGTDKSWSEGDFNGDLVVDISDLGILAGNYGFSTGGAVPEPATLMLLLAGGVLSIMRNRRK